MAPALHVKPPDNPVYMGVRLDACVAWHYSTEPLEDGESLGGRLVEFIGCMADIPFSAIADTVLLPLTLYASVKRAENTRARESAATTATPTEPTTGHES
jgi:uncharacterized protein YceK